MHPTLIVQECFYMLLLDQRASRYVVRSVSSVVFGRMLMLSVPVTARRLSCPFSCVGMSAI